MPILPKTPFNIVDTLNPFDIGVVVVFMSLLSFISYLLMRFTNAEKGILISALIGGLYSSTMITWIFSSKSKTHPARSKTYAAGILVACTLMFLRILVLAVVFNRHLFLPLLIPTLLAVSMGSFHSYQLIRQGVSEEKDVEKIDLGNPMDLLSAIGFGILFVAIAVSLFFMQKWFGTSGVYITGLIVGSAEVDAVTISMAKLNSITPQIAANVITIASLSNTLVKLSVALLRGSVDLRKEVFIRLGSMLLVGCAYLLVMHIIG
jgi:uncharacterized membrane protein (DUF4010 family)